MYALSPDRKKYLLRQSQQFRTVDQRQGGQPPYAASYGPSSGGGILPRLVPQLTGDSGLLKRISIMGWGSPSTQSSSDQSGHDGSVHDLPRSPPNSPARPSEELQPLMHQNTGSLWSGWWSSAGGEKLSPSDNSRSGELKSATWYIDSLKSSKAYDIKLVKHLITLRVHLSTAKLAFIQDFVCPQKGLDALGKLLAGLVGKAGKRKVLSEMENTVLLEVIKCFRVLLNTDVCFQMILPFPLTSYE